MCASGIEFLIKTFNFVSHCVSFDAVSFREFHITLDQRFFVTIIKLSIYLIP